MFFDRHESGERVLLVHCEFSTGSLLAQNNAAHPSPNIGSSIPSAPTLDTTDIDSRYSACPEEFADLARSAGLEVVDLITTRRAKPTSKFFIGSGKVGEIKYRVEHEKVDVVMFNHGLSPSQERSLEQELCCKVVDRTGLILDIFAQRARSHSGKLQVELAQLRHISSRLVRGWSHLKRQRGGIGIRGPGESQLETDRRLLHDRIQWINRRLAKVNAQRQQGRRARQRAELPTIALVGYTNAGKSTLFNRLSTAEVYAADQLFATLDPTLRAIDLPRFGKVVIADTVGFVRHLPDQLVAAFKATLEEAAGADLLLHVIDASAEDVALNIHAVYEVLSEIGVGDIPILQVMNKIDCLASTQVHCDYTAEQGIASRVWLSAHSGDGVEELKEAIAERLGGAFWQGTVALTASQAKLRAQLYSVGAVTDEAFTDQGDYQLTLSFPRDDLIRLIVGAGHELPAEILPAI